jgi:hypothetical protein
MVWLQEEDLTVFRIPHGVYVKLEKVGTRGDRCWTMICVLRLWLIHSVSAQLACDEASGLC